MRDEKGRFKKGIVPWSKLNPHLCKPNSGSFKKGHIPKHKKGWVFSAGYIEVLIPKHPFAMRRGYVWEHRLVVEQQLGFYLPRKTSVHHLNKIKTDNRPENLMAFTSDSAHQRFHKNPDNVKPEEIIFDGRNLSHILGKGTCC